MYTVGKLAKKFGLSRSTLLYYDSIGIFSPSLRGGSNYRLYSEEDCKKLERICKYREAGISIQKIKDIISCETNEINIYLEERFNEINNEIALLRRQQHYIMTFLEKRELSSGIVDILSVRELMKMAGISDETKWRFHHAFETQYPERHQAFLELLGLDRHTVEEIRTWAR
ncbi:MAG: MerR family transcriptional regulator [Candidatus Eremiobacterota bacterium]